MGVEKFLRDMEDFLNTTNVNLGRKKSKNREKFIQEVLLKIKNFIKPNNNINRQSEVLCLKPTKKNAMKLKGHAHEMTESESMKADEELGRSRFGG